jgi:peptide/nickel transport system permease protein
MAGSTPASATASPAPLGKPTASVSPWAEAWRRFKRHRLAYWSLWVLGLLVLAVLIGPLFYKVGVNDVDFQARLAGPSWKHPMGTDDLGRPTQRLDLTVVAGVAKGQVVTIVTGEPYVAVNLDRT